MNNFKGKTIILFDGVCNLCNSFINFIIKHDHKKQFLFASLQSDVAKEILLQFSQKRIALDSIVFIENNYFYEKSTAVLKILKHLNGGFTLLYGFKIIPKILRDWLYNQIAKNRYNWFGKNKNCIIPSPEVKNRFLG